MAKVQMNVWVEAEDRDALKQVAEERGVSLGGLIRAVAGQLRPAPGSGREVEDLRVRVAGLEEQVEGYEQRLARLEELASGASY